MINWLRPGGTVVNFYKCNDDTWIMHRRRTLQPAAGNTLDMKSKKGILGQTPASALIKSNRSACRASLDPEERAVLQHCAKGRVVHKRRGRRWDSVLIQPSVKHPYIYLLFIIIHKKRTIPPAMSYNPRNQPPLQRMTTKQLRIAALLAPTDGLLYQFDSYLPEELKSYHLAVMDFFRT